MKIFLLTITIILLSFNAIAQDITASTNKNKVGFNEAFSLNISIDKQISKEPNFSAIEKDFQILRVKNYFSTQIINGIMSQKLEYALTLMPKKEGELIIPAIEIDGMMTAPIKIDVLKASQMPQSNQPQVSFEGKLEKDQAFVQEEINYSIYLIDDGSLEISEPRHADTKDFIIKSLGSPSITAIEKQGQRMRQVKFDYALFPQKSGELTIPMFESQGFAIEKTTINDPFALGIFNSQKRPIALRTPSKKINITPAPKDWDNKWWLPAQNIELKAEFITNNFEIGKPIKRKISITSVGILESQLPEIEFIQAENIRQYPGQSQANVFVQNNEIFATKEVVHTYIATQEGNITLPAIEVKWFDVKNKQIKTATIKEETIYIKSNTISSPNKNTSPSQTTSSQKQAEPQISSPKTKEKTLIKEPLPNKNQETPTKPSGQITTYIISFASLLFGVVIGALLSKSLKKINYKKLVKSSKNNKELEKNIILWAQSKFSEIYNIQDVAQAVDDKDFNIQIQSLSQNLYANNNDFNKKEFIKAFNKISSKKYSKDKKEILPELYN